MKSQNRGIFLNMLKVKNALPYALLFFLPTQLGTYFFLDFSYVFGIRVDYLAPTLFFTDVLVLVLISLMWKNLSKTLPYNLLFLLLIIAGINISFAQVRLLALFGWIKFFELLFLFWSIRIFRFRKKTLYLVLLASTSMVLFLAVSHIVNKASVQGIWYWLGERRFTINTIDIARVSFQNVVVLRPYATFSHPNSLGGFYLLWYSYILFDQKNKDLFLIRSLLLGLFSILIVVSFSRLAIIGFVGVSVWNMFQKEKYKNCLLCVVSRLFLLLAVLFFLFQISGDPLSFQKRILLISESLRIFVEHGLVGVGLKNYVFVQQSADGLLPYAFIQPVHSIFLLLLTELGAPIFVTLCWVGYKSLQKVRINSKILVVFAVVVVAGLFDHYWLTLQQNFLLIPVVFGLLYQEKV